MLDWLVAFRKNNNKSQDDIAALCGISRSYYSLIETGERSPSVDTAKKIAKVLDFDWTKFFDGDKS